MFDEFSKKEEEIMKREDAELKEIMKEIKKFQKEEEKRKERLKNLWKTPAPTSIIDIDYPIDYKIL